MQPRASSIPTHTACRASEAGLDVSAAMTAGFVAGWVALVAWIACSVSIYDEPASKLPRMIAAMILGQGALGTEDEPELAVVATGLVLHFALALSFGTALALLVRHVREGLAACAGALFGVALYVLDLHLLTAFFPWFTQLRTLDTLGAHMLFGILAATAYRDLASPPSATSPPRR